MRHTLVPDPNPNHLVRKHEGIYIYVYISRHGKCMRPRWWFGTVSSAGQRDLDAGAGIEDDAEALAEGVGVAVLEDAESLEETDDEVGGFGEGELFCGREKSDARD